MRVGKIAQLTLQAIDNIKRPYDDVRLARHVVVDRSDQHQQQLIEQRAAGYGEVQRDADAALRAERAELLEALRTYGRHHTTCHLAVDHLGEYLNCYRPLGGCDCGFDAALARAEGRQEP